MFPPFQPRDLVLQRFASETEVFTVEWCEGQRVKLENDPYLYAATDLVAVDPCP